MSREHHPEHERLTHHCPNCESLARRNEFLEWALREALAIYPMSLDDYGCVTWNDGKHATHDAPNLAKWLEEVV